MGALWDATGAKLVLPLVRAKTSTALLYKAGGFSDTVPGDVLLLQYVSEPLAAQTVAGTWTAVARGYESDAAFNASMQMVVRIVSGDGVTTRGTVYAGHATANNATAGALGQEFPTTANETRLIPGVTGTGVAASAGDRLVIELGYRADYTTGVAYSGELAVHDDQGADHALTAGVTSTAFNPWVETDQALTFQSVAPPSIEGVAVWKVRFDAQASSFSTYNLPKSQTADSMDYYDMAYGVDGYVSMFEATASTTYLTSAITLVNNMIGDAVISSSLGPDAWGDSYLGWVTQRIDLIGEEVPLFESYCWRYVCRLLTALKDNAAVYANATFKAHYDSILAFTEVNIFDKWYNRGLNSYVYRQNTNMAAHWAYISCHLRQHTLNATRQTRCDTIRGNIDSLGIPNYSGDSMRAKMTASLGRALAGAYSWDSDWGATGLPGQDTSHACAEITWICESLDHFSVWNSTDVTRFGKTLTDLIMPTHAQYVNGTGSGTGWIADGWPKLGRFDVAIQLALEDYDTQNQGQYMASMAENARRWGVA